jgi:ectoine hydroxylase-related dioxygenase (phytanoyl-CoA dioxygenase family)
VGRPGAIFSFPGCRDQTIHADAPQLFLHSHLPPHYVNLFLPVRHNVESPATSASGLRGFHAGLTAFLIGSHRLEVSSRIMADNDQEELERRLIRPQLRVGDALLFDCRTLHFGLANQSSDSTDSECWRPLMYLNIHHQWFHDPKNWNDKERLHKKTES